MVVAAGAEVNEVVRALGVDSGAKSNTGDGTGLHGVIRKGVNCKMDVITKIETEMGRFCGRAAGDDCGWADG